MAEDAGNPTETVHLLQDELDRLQKLIVDNNTRLEAANRMYAALVRARAKFREYTVSHRNKNTADGNQKAYTNAEMGMVCDNAILAWERSRS